MSCCVAVVIASDVAQRVVQACMELEYNGFGTFDVKAQ